MSARRPAIDDTAAPAATRPREILFLLICHDGPDGPRQRALQMQAHLANVERLGDRIVVAGPALDPQGRINASVLVVRAADAAAACALLADDPYRLRVWATIEVRPFLAVCGSAIGGVTWEPVDDQPDSGAPREPRP